MPGPPWIVEVEINGRTHLILDADSTDAAGARERVRRDAYAGAGGIVSYLVDTPDGPARLDVQWRRVAVWRLVDVRRAGPRSG